MCAEGWLNCAFKAPGDPLAPLTDLAVGVVNNIAIDTKYNVACAYTQGKTKMFGAGFE